MKLEGSTVDKADTDWTKDQWCPCFKRSIKLRQRFILTRPTHITFWDIRRAFDSSPRNLQKLAWMRMGVSKGLAEWFIELDDGGLSFIDTPLYVNTSDLHSHEDMLKRKKHMCSAKNIKELIFKAERGIGQEESASSLQWTVLYDMVLKWIDSKNRKLYEDENLQEYSNKNGSSILKWTKKSGIVVASREYEDHQSIRDRINNATTIKKYAREAQLWPHEEIFGEDKVLCDVKFYVTDGSFTVKTTGAKDIITLKQTL
jgi:hypothetical protein